jgi:hypothetical protein
MRRNSGKNRIFRLAIWPKLRTLSCVNQRITEVHRLF